MDMRFASVLNFKYFINSQLTEYAHAFAENARYWLKKFCPMFTPVDRIILLVLFLLIPGLSAQLTKMATASIRA